MKSKKSLHPSRFTLPALLFTLVSLPSFGEGQKVDFDHYFDGRTLRLDYTLAGDSASADIYFSQASVLPQWAGRRHWLAETFLNGNAQIEVRLHATDSLLYVHTFSTLFQEWQTEEEATKVRKAYQYCLLVPFPKRPVDITVRLTDVHQRTATELTHTIDPTDILIRPISDNGIAHRYLLQNGTPDECVDIAILAEGYTADQMEKFHADSQRVVDALFSHEPFCSLRNCFNVVAIDCPSADSGPSIPHRNTWRRTAIGAHYDTFYTERYLMVTDLPKVYDLLGTVPFEHVIVLVNTDVYGGGGIYNQITVTTSNHPTFKQVLVHEFGHAYAGLADEYYYDDQFTTMYPDDTEPWEPNITTLVDFQRKWADMVGKRTPIPTPPVNVKDEKASDKKRKKLIHELTQQVGVFEGGGYQSKGVYRPAQECRMKVNEVEDFCPVCARAIRRTTEFYTRRNESRR